MSTTVHRCPNWVVVTTVVNCRRRRSSELCLMWFSNLSKIRSRRADSNRLITRFLFLYRPILPCERRLPSSPPGRLPRVLRALRGNRAAAQYLRRVCRNVYLGSFQQTDVPEEPTELDGRVGPLPENGRVGPPP